MIDAHARRTLETQQLGGLQADLAVDHDIVLADKKGNAKTERADRRRDLAHMGGVTETNLASGRTNVFQQQVANLQRREHVIAQGARGRRRRRQPREPFTPAPALAFQLLLERSLDRERVGIDSGHLCYLLVGRAAHIEFRRTGPWFGGQSAFILHSVPCRIFPAAGTISAGLRSTRTCAARGRGQCRGWRTRDGARPIL